MQRATRSWHFPWSSPAATVILTALVIMAVPPPCQAQDCHFNGDPDGTGIITAADVSLTVGVAFRDLPAIPDETCDNDRTDVAGCGGMLCDGITDALDVAGLCQFLFAGGYPPQCAAFTGSSSSSPSGSGLADAADMMQQNSVLVESRTVPAGATGVTIGVHVENTIDVYGMVLPLEFRAVTPGAFAAPGSLSLTVQGRIGGSSLSTGISSSLYYDTPSASSDCSGPISSTWSAPADVPDGLGSSPDALMWTGQSFSSSLTAGSDGTPGSGTPSFVLTFDVNQTGGSFEIDTCCVAPANHLLFIEYGTLACVTPAFTKGVVTVECLDTDADGWADPEAGAACTPWDNCPADFNPGQEDTDGDGIGDACEPPPPYAEVVIESKTVSVGETGVSLAISIGSEEDIAALQIPLVARSLSGGAFWTGSLDTVPAYGRLTSALTEIRVLEDGDVDFTSPDAFAVAYIRIVSPCLASGTLEEMTGLTFDVNSNPGQFEIDSAALPPAGTFLYQSCLTSESHVPSSFTKGIITIQEPITGNKVVIESKTVPRKALGQTVTIAIANESDLTGFEIPLVARSLTGGAFWSANLDTLHAFGRLESALTAVRAFRDGEVDYESPDPFSLAYIKILDACLGAGSLQPMTGLTFDVGSFIGSFEIDSAFMPPASELLFANCTGGATLTPEFTRGIITVGPSASNSTPVAACRAVAAEAGQDCEAAVDPSATDNGSYDPDGDPVIMRLNPPGPYSLGVHQVWLIVDDTQDADSCQTTILVEDHTPPVAQCPGNMQVPNDPGECGAVVTFSATATDNCPGVSVSCNPPSGSFFPGGTTTPVQCIADDAHGNADTCSFNVTVEACGAPNAVVIESKTVAAGQAGVQAEISIANDVDISNITLPLIARTVSGDAFWDVDIDTVPAYGRLTSALTEIRVLNTTSVDFTSPDPLILAYVKITSPCVSSGPLQGMTALVFDVQNKGGVFEIDTALYPPANTLAFASCVLPMEEIKPEFTKGIITVMPPLDGNQVVVESKAVAPGQTGVTIAVSIANEADVQGISLPLVVRSVSGGAFWSGDLDTIHAVGRLESALTEIRLFNKGSVDYSSPDPLLLTYIRLFSPCLASGLLQEMIGLRFNVGANEGIFEIDTAFFPPTNTLTFVDCVTATAIDPDFTKGLVTVGTPPVCQCDCHADPQCDGATDVLDVVKAVNVAFRSADPITDPSPTCPYESTDANCSGFTDVIDVVKFVNVAFRGGSPATEFCDPCP